MLEIASDTAPSDVKRPRVRRWRRTALLVTAIVVIAASIYKITAQKRAVLAIEKLGGHVGTEPAGAAWLPEVLRNDYLFDVSQAMLVGDHITNRDLARLAFLRSIKWLRIQSPQVTDEGLTCIHDQTDLTRLMLSGTNVTDAGLEHLRGLTNLQELGLRGPQITDAGLKHLASLTSLTSLLLPETGITDAGLAHLGGLRELEVLDLSKTAITDAGLPQLYQLKKLEIIELSDTDVSSGALAKLRDALPEAQITTDRYTDSPASTTHSLKIGR